jgi:hypothetical protein
MAITVDDSGIMNGVVFERGTNRPPRSQSTVSQRILVTFSVRMPVNSVASWRSRRIGFESASTRRSHSGMSSSSMRERRDATATRSGRYARS